MKIKKLFKDLLAKVRGARVKAKSPSGVCAVCGYRWPLKKDGSPVSHFVWGADGRRHCAGSKELHAPPSTARRQRKTTKQDADATPSPR